MNSTTGKRNNMSFGLLVELSFKLFFLRNNITHSNRDNSNKEIIVITVIISIVK